jgi:hypothetical protein
MNSQVADLRYGASDHGECKAADKGDDTEPRCDCEFSSHGPTIGNDADAYPIFPARDRPDTHQITEHGKEEENNSNRKRKAGGRKEVRLSPKDRDDDEATCNQRSKPAMKRASIAEPLNNKRSTGVGDFGQMGVVLWARHGDTVRTDGDCNLTSCSAADRRGAKKWYAASGPSAAAKVRARTTQRHGGSFSPLIIPKIGRASSNAEVVIRNVTVTKSFFDRPISIEMPSGLKSMRRT